MPNESLSGTQSRQIFTTSSTINPSEPPRIKRVDQHLLNSEPDDLRIADVPLLVRELRRVVVALDERGGFVKNIENS